MLLFTVNSCDGDRTIIGFYFWSTRLFITVGLAPGLDLRVFSILGLSPDADLFRYIVFAIGCLFVDRAITVVVSLSAAWLFRGVPFITSVFIRTSPVCMCVWGREGMSCARCILVLRVPCRWHSHLRKLNIWGYGSGKFFKILSHLLRGSRAVTGTRYRSRAYWQYFIWFH